MTRTGTVHLGFAINRAEQKSLWVDHDFARRVLALADGMAAGSAENRSQQRVTVQEARRLVALARADGSTADTVTLADSGIVLTQNDARRLLRLAEPGVGHHSAQLGSGGSTITAQEAREVVRTAERGEARIGRVTQAELDRVEAWRNRRADVLAPEAARILDAFVQRGADHVGRIDPTVSTSRVVYPNYDQLFADGVFDHMVVIGYDETGAHLSQIARFAHDARQLGFVPIENATLTPEEQERLARLEPSITLEEMVAAAQQIPQVVRYFVRRVRHPQTGEEVLALQRLVLPIDQPPGSEAAAQQASAKTEYIRRHMGHVDAFLYGGHARYGTGPDIDHIDSPAGNVRLAQGYSSRPAVGPIDTHTNIDWPERYQLLLFAGCTTSHYLSSFQAPHFRDHRDVIVTNQLAYWSGTAPSITRMLGGLFATESYNELISGMDEASDFTGLYEARYLGNNTFMPRPSEPLRGLSTFAALYAGEDAPDELTLPRGENADARILQQYLSLATLDLPPLHLDGDAGPSTARRIMEFKRRNSIDPPTAGITRELLERLEQVVRDGTASGGS